MMERLRGFFIVLCVLVKGLSHIYISIAILHEYHLGDFAPQPAPLI